MSVIFLKLRIKTNCGFLLGIKQNVYVPVIYCTVHGYFHALFRLSATGTKGRKNPGANIFVYTDIQQNNLTLWFTGYMVYREKLNRVLDMIIRVNDM